MGIYHLREDDRTAFSRPIEDLFDSYVQPAQSGREGWHDDSLARKLARDIMGLDPAPDPHPVEGTPLKASKAPSRIFFFVFDEGHYI